MTQNNIPAVVTTTICQPTMPFYEFNQYNTLCIQATLGLGKTNTLYDFLKYNLGNKYNSCLIVSFRRSLCAKYLQDLPSFELYEKIIDSTIDSSLHSRLICQVDSLKRIRGKYDLVIFDEVSYTLNHIVSSVSDKKRCHDNMIQLMYDNNHMIFMDALFNHEMVQYIQSFNRKISYIINEYTIHDDKKVFNYNTNKTALIDEFKKSIENGENVAIATNNKDMLDFIDNLLINDYKHIKKLFIKRENKLNYDLNQWKTVQVLGYTPSIVAGISYTEKHFDKMFGIFCNTSATADMALQQLFRVRNISSKEFHICCDITGKNDYPEIDEDIRNLIIKEDKCLVKGLENITIDYIKKNIIEDEYFNLFRMYQKNKFKSCNNFMKELIKLLNKQGITKVTNITKYNEENKKLFLKNKRNFNKMKKEHEAKRIEDADDATEEEIENIRENINRDETDNYMLKKNKIKKVLMIKKVTKDIVLKYSKSGNILWNLAYIHGYENYIYQLNKRLNYEEKKYDYQDNTIRLGRKRKYEKMVLCDHMVKEFGFTSPFDRNSINIDREKFKEYIIKYHDIIETYFKCNKLDMNIFNKENWYNICKRYINSKLRSIYGISIVEDRKTKKQYIKGLDFWCDEVTYKNNNIIKDIKEKEEEIYENEEIESNLMDILNASIDEEFNYYDNSNSANSYIEEYKNKKCINCNNNVINNNIKCLQCKFKK